MRILVAAAPIVTALVLLIGCAKAWSVSMHEVKWPTNGGVLVQSQRIYIAEDSPEWDCHTMGNLLCNPKTRRIDR